MKQRTFLCTIWLFFAIVFIPAPAATAVGVASLSAVALASDPAITLPSTPFQITIQPDTKMALYYNGGQQFYGTNASGIFVWAGASAYGPSSIPAGNIYLPYTPVSNTLIGDGSAGSPWQITTVVDVGAT